MIDYQAMEIFKSFEKKILNCIAHQFSSWRNLSSECFSFEIIDIGLTNYLTVIKKKDLYHMVNIKNEPKEIFVRIYDEHTSHFIDHDVEEKISNILSKTGISPQIYGFFPGGRIEQYIANSTIINKKNMHDIETIKLAARLIAHVHSQSSSYLLVSDKDSIPRSKSIIMNLMSKNFKAFLESAEINSSIFKSLQLSSLEEEVNWLFETVEQMNMSIVLSHRDVHNGNILKVEEENRKNRFFLIDFDYSGLDYCCFDFGNYFCELTINNFYSQYPGFTVDHSLHLGQNLQRIFFQEYLDHVHDKNIIFPHTQTNLSNENMIDLLISYSKFGILLSHLQWGLWGINMSHKKHSKFSHLDYAAARINAYWAFRKSM